MNQKTFSLTVGFIFLILGLLHIARIVYGVNMVVADWPIPMWVSGAGAIVAFALAFFSFQINRGGR